MDRDSMTTLYVRAKTKADVHARLDAGVPVFGLRYHQGRETMVRLDTWPHGARVALYHRTFGSTPRARAWYTWDWHKRRLV